MTILVTGAAGFIGSAIARRLAVGEEPVVGIDALTDYYDPALKRANVDSIPGNFDFRHADLNDVDIDHLLDGVTTVFHQAGQPGVRKSWGSDFQAYVDANISATQRLLEAARRSAGLRRVVYASSSSVYGNAETYPTSEEERPQPVSPYGVTKLAAEHLCSLYASNFGVPVVSLRYFTVYGPGQRPDMAFNRFIRAAQTDAAIPVYGSGEQVREFTFVDDVVNANVSAAQEKVDPGTVFNVSGGTSISVNDVLDLLSDIAGHRLRINRTDAVDGDVRRTGGSVEKIRSTLGWRPRTSIEEGLRAQWDSLVQPHSSSTGA